MTDWQHGFYKLSADDRRQQLNKSSSLSPLEEQGYWQIQVQI